MGKVGFTFIIKVLGKVKMPEGRLVEAPPLKEQEAVIERGSKSSSTKKELRSITVF